MAGPLFKLTPDEGGEAIIARSATAAWAEVLKGVTKAREAVGYEIYYHVIFDQESWDKIGC